MSDVHASATKSPHQVLWSKHSALAHMEYEAIVIRPLADSFKMSLSEKLPHKYRQGLRTRAESLLLTNVLHNSAAHIRNVNNNYLSDIQRTGLTFDVTCPLLHSPKNNGITLLQRKLSPPGRPGCTVTYGS
ncbi:hypothetical protein J6590_002245 [Homalodisca vitripennis]|nr:hypothetical protein J6590_002245 [Homalodisca vitripennis]